MFCPKLPCPTMVKIFLRNMKYLILTRKFFQYLFNRISSYCLFPEFLFRI